MRKFLDWLKSVLGERILALVLSQVLTKDNIQTGLKGLLDYLAELADKTENKIDDKVVESLRKALIVSENE